MPLEVALVVERLRKVDAVEEVAVIVPTVSCPTDDEEKKLSMKRPMEAKKEVEVAFVAVKLPEIKALP